MKFTKLVAASLLAIAAAPIAAQAQDAAPTQDAGPDLSVGTMVYGPDGNEVGKIDQVSGGNIVVNTGNNVAALPASSFVQGKNGPVIGLTKEQLDAELDKAKAEAAAKLNAALVQGATVYGIQGVPVGTVKQITPDGKVVIAHKVGDVPLAKNQFTTTDKGLALKFTAAQLDQALAPRMEMQAKVKAALVAGATLVTSDGAPAGTIRELNDKGEAVIDYAEKAFALPPNQFVIDSQGRLALNMSQAQLNAALGVSGS
jgi:preprotein translocase subunit YajC